MDPNSSGLTLEQLDLLAATPYTNPDRPSDVWLNAAREAIKARTSAPIAPAAPMVAEPILEDIPADTVSPAANAEIASMATRLELPTGGASEGLDQLPQSAAPITPMVGTSAPKANPPVNVAPAVSPFATQTEETRTRKIVDPAALKTIEDTAKSIAANQYKAGEVEEKVLENTAQRDATKSKLIDEQARIQQEGADRAAQLWKDYEAKSGAMIQDYLDSNIRPPGIYDGNLGQNILAGISIAMGSIGGSLLGTNQNVALDIINKAIDRDIDAQKANLGKKRDAINMLGVQYEAARRAGMDETQAKLTSKAYALDQVAAFYDAKANELKQPLAKQNAEIARDKTLQEAARVKADLTASTVTTQTKQIASPTSAANVSLEPKEKERVTDAQKMLNFIDEVRAMRQAGLGGAISDRVQDWLAPVGLGNEEEQRYLARVGAANSQYRKMVSGLTVSDKERVELLKQFPTPGDTDAQFYGKLKAIADLANQDISSVGEAYRLRPGDRTKDGFIWQGVPTSANEVDQKMGLKPTGK